MTATHPNPLFQATAQLPELLALFEVGVHATIEEWEKLCNEGLRAGQLESLQEYHDYHEGVLSGYLKMLDGSLQLTSQHSDRDAVELTARQHALRDQVATHYATFFPRWRTVEDLEDILLAQRTPSNGQLKALAAKSPPPQSWYDEVWEDAP